uniref:Core-2/I-Branching enzyme family protein n=1 Tax=Wuchereria bancrofti TaxID=6293 RepID=A0A1I8EU89_WUCBA
MEELLLLDIAEAVKRKPPLLSAYTLEDEICKQLLMSYKHSKMSQMNKYVVTVNRSSDKHWDTSCNAIRQRGFYPAVPLSSAEKNFPLAFIRIVYKDFHLQELLFNLMYAPQNFYCYALDAKSTSLFHSQMRNLSKCFSNVLLTEREYEVDSAGHNMSRSFLECLRVVRRLPGWKYAILLQNNDIPLKSNREMVQILSALNGSNDINIGYPNADRVPNGAPWTFRALTLFNDEKQNDDRKLRIAKGSTSASLSYAFVEFVVDKLNLTILLDKFDRLSYGVDEMLFPSLNSEDSLGAPGGFTRQCIDVYNNMITRYVVWKKSMKHCRSGQYRHDICIFGIADLPTMVTSRALFANKMLPEYDYTAIGCWAHFLHNRTYSAAKIMPTKLNYYANRLPVRFHNERERWKLNLSAFNCSCFEPSNPRQN